MSEYKYGVTIRTWKRNHYSIIIPDPSPTILKNNRLKISAPTEGIISDGLVSVIPVRFGGNYTRSFKEIYMTAKRNSSIIKSI